MSEHCGHVHGQSLAQGPGQPSEAPSFELPGATEHYAADRPVRAEHVRLEVELDFERQVLRGACITTIRTIREVKSFAFDAMEMEVEGARVNGERAEVLNSGGQLRVTPRRPLGAQATAEVVLDYHCRPTRGLWFKAPDEAVPDRPLQAWTQGQDEDARYWFPCLDAPAQKARTEVLATFPAHMTALSNGVLVSDVVTGKRRTMHYRFDYPHAPYLVTLVVGEFDESRDRLEHVELRYLYPKGRREDALRCVGRTPEMIRLFEQLFGEPYPFGIYSQVFVTEFILGAMEHTSATTLIDTVLHDEQAHLDYSAESLVAHELSHQWFGNLLTCRDWPHGWLNEGFATHCEVLWKEHAEGLDEADQLRRENLDAYLSEVKERYVRPIVARRFHAPIELFDRHLYEKGGLVLHELRRRLKDGLFFKAIRHYVGRHAFRTVETVDLARAIEEVTGHNFDSFFDQYVFSPGHPQLEVEVRYQADGNRVQLRVRQTQKTDRDGTPLYRLPLDVRLVVDGMEIEHTLEIADADRVFFLPCPRPPTQVRVDPRREVLGTLAVDKPLEYWIEELQRAEEARARTEAALALGREGSRRAVDALVGALADEGFWATQAACAKALGLVRTPAAKRALLDHLELPHPKARRAVVAALGGFRLDAEVFAALAKRCEAGDASYFVEGEAARSLGKLRLPDALPLLRKVAERSSFQDVIAAGAIDGMAESQEPAAFEAVVPFTRYGHSMFVRRAAALALARLAEPAQKKGPAVEVLAELMRDPEFRVQLAALQGARLLGDRRLLGALEGTPFRDGRVRRMARETMRALREGEPQAKEVAALREEVDWLKQEARKLKEGLEALAAAPGRRKGRKP